MGTIKTVERKIKEVEGFDVKFFRNDRDIRSDLTDIPAYPYSNRAPDSNTVSDYVSNRFKKNYPGFDAKVYCADGSEAIGQTKLGTVRMTY
ncbi:hypothetical protein FACS1894216_15670 [Synergistales bacterium]|nr:hypothetical protein FACS1894216_15670 [Synergistales bacterium]